MIMLPSEVALVLPEWTAFDEDLTNDHLTIKTVTQDTYLDTASGQAGHPIKTYPISTAILKKLASF